MLTLFLLLFSPCIANASLQQDKTSFVFVGTIESVSVVCARQVRESVDSLINNHDVCICSSIVQTFRGRKGMRNSFKFGMAACHPLMVQHSTFWKTGLRSTWMMPIKLSRNRDACRVWKILKTPRYFTWHRNNFFNKMYTHLCLSQQGRIMYWRHLLAVNATSHDLV